MRIERYSSEHRDEWNSFVSASRNATFLFDRGFMDYHSDRFTDCSLIARDGERIKAMLPANIVETGAEKRLYSHQGLTYGGWLLSPTHFSVTDMLEVFEKTKEWSQENGISEIVYKPVPHIYHRMPSEEDLYALWRNGAEMVGTGISATIDLRCEAGYDSQQKRNLKRAEKAGVRVEEDFEVETFHRILEECLSERHGVKPVHTAEELRLLKNRFPGNIRIYLAKTEGKAEAGACMFLCGRVWHSQYICTTSKGRETGALALLFDTLIKAAREDEAAEYFDFGISTEEGGRVLNSGLMRQKYGLGGSGTIYPVYKLEI